MILIFAIFAGVFVVSLLLARRYPAYAKFSPCLLILAAVFSGYLGATSSDRKAWWWAPPVMFLILSITEFLRQRKLAREKH
jgi:hypothetical protein